MPKFLVFLNDNVTKRKLMKEEEKFNKYGQNKAKTRINVSGKIHFKETPQLPQPTTSTPKTVKPLRG